MITIQKTKIFTKINQVLPFLKKGAYSQIFILVDEGSARHCLASFKKQIPLKMKVLRIPSGESSKQLKTCEFIWEQLQKSKADRQTLLINLGGGIVGDLGGFAASVYMRGIDYIHVPTTLMAMADSCLGGKTGINFGSFKNHIGTFAPAKLIFLDTSFLKTLSQTEWLDGYTEIIKHSLIADSTLWNALENSKNLSEKVTDKKIKALIQKSLSIKENISSLDPKEKAERKLLNYGHTFAHAMESVYAKKKMQLSHGQALACGILFESFLSYRYNTLSLLEYKRIQSFVLKNYFLKPLLSETWILQFMKGDKKNSLGQINFSLLSKIGKADFNQTLSEKQILEGLKHYTSLLSR